MWLLEHYHKERDGLGLKGDHRHKRFLHLYSSSFNFWWVFKHIFNGCSTYVYFMFLTREAVLFLRSINEEFISVPKLEHPKQMMEFLFFGDHFYYLSSHCLQYLSTCHFRSSLWVLQREQLKTLTGLLDAKERYSVVIIYYFLSLSFFWLLIFIISLSWSAFLSFPPTAYWVSW